MCIRDSCILLYGSGDPSNPFIRIENTIVSAFLLIIYPDNVETPDNEPVFIYVFEGKFLSFKVPSSPPFGKLFIKLSLIDSLLYLIVFY